MMARCNLNPCCGETMPGKCTGSASDPALAAASDYADYDAGLLNDFGGGNVDWWWDYLRAEIERANDFWRSQVATPPDTAKLIAEAVALRERVAELEVKARGADAVIAAIERAIPDWRSYRDLVDAVECKVARS